ncbi:nuclear transport factor 2 family protein [Pandoraea pulmonicola]|uniref:SnoaL-like domain n=1 Tax=Pandoraea pulmonicola TaxID=93221 RepID=A0AAJ4ZGD3_PANPU|nr:nuclear transport factor 2 family protein [Pandoraea pulmonicola]AJC22887.1 hypothetical protein RO07_24925 [Pandoraea pulmonicola]SUA92790.1 SnoaL-like domain [Pandoraea pulmonicola]
MVEEAKVPLAERASNIALQCQWVVIDFTAAFDDGNHEEMVRNMAPDGIWKRADGEIRGHDALRTFMARRPAGLLVRHVLSNLRTRLVSPEDAIVESYVTAYRHESPQRLDAPAPLPGPHVVGRYRDELRLVDGEWKLACRQVYVDFKHP